jgi:hypothetical protein
MTMKSVRHSLRDSRRGWIAYRGAVAGVIAGPGKPQLALTFDDGLSVIRAAAGLRDLVRTA